MQPTPRAPRPKKSPLARYGPFIAVVVAIAVIAIVAGNRGSNDSSSSSGSGSSSSAATGDALIRSGPMTPQKAKLTGATPDFGPGCDASLGTVKIPWTYAAPCVEPFTGDNGGATSPGVTADSIKVIVYQTDPRKDPLQSALVKGAGADVDLDTARQTYQGWTDLFSDHYELYGRKVQLEFYTGTGAPDDPVAAKADAKAIADKQPFAVWGGPLQTDAFADELAANKVVCLGPCSTAQPERFVRERTPYLWGTGPLPEQASRLTAEMIGKQLVGKKAQYAGDPSLRSQTRKFGIVHYDTPAGQQREAYKTLKAALAEEGVKPAADVQYYLDVARAQENARTIIAKLKAAKVTTVIFYGDPLTPIFMTKEATAQSFSPEWVIGPTVYVDTAVFGRRFDQEQWKHAFGISLIGARGTQETQESYALYKWQYGKAPVNNQYAVILQAPAIFFRGVHLAGPNLTPETFRDGLFRAPVSGGTPFSPTTSWGRHGLWPGVDLGGSDDLTLIWWNPEAKGQDEIGNDGTGLYEFVSGGDRYVLGKIPTSPVKWFDPAGAVTIYKSIPKQYQPPQYPSPAGTGG